MSKVSFENKITNGRAKLVRLDAALLSQGLLRQPVVFILSREVNYLPVIWQHCKQALLVYLVDNQIAPMDSLFSAEKKQSACVRIFSRNSLESILVLRTLRSQ